jgi:hypothetical protein
VSWAGSARTARLSRHLGLAATPRPMPMKVLTAMKLSGCAACCWLSATKGVNCKRSLHNIVRRAFADCWVARQFLPQGRAQPLARPSTYASSRLPWAKSAFGNLTEGRSTGQQELHPHTTALAAPYLAPRSLCQQATESYNSTAANLYRLVRWRTGDASRTHPHLPVSVISTRSREFPPSASLLASSKIGSTVQNAAIGTC